QRGRIVPETQVAAPDFDVLPPWPRRVDAAAPVDDAVTPGVYGCRRYRHWCSELAGPDIEMLSMLVSVPVERLAGAALAPVTDRERAAERDDLAHQLGTPAGQLTGVDPAQAP